MIPIRESAVIYIQDTHTPPIAWRDEFEYRLVPVIINQDIITRIHHEHPVAIITDVQDTPTLCKQIRHDIPYNLLLIALVENNPDQITTALSAGATDCIVRPVQQPLLEHRIQSLINNTSIHSDNTYRHLFDSANDAIFINDLITGKFIDINRQAVKWLGYSRDEYLSMDYNRILHNSSLGLSGGAPMQEISTHGPLIAEQTFINKYGKSFPAEVSSCLIMYEGQRAALHLARDMRNRKEIEATEQTQQKLVEALRLTANNLNNTLAIDAIANKGIEHILGNVPGEFVNMMLFEGNNAFVYAYKDYSKEPKELQEDFPWKIDPMPLFEKISETQQTLIVDDLQTWEEWQPTPLLPARSYIGVPLLVQDEIIGLMQVGHGQPGKLTKDDAHILEAFASQAAITIHNARLNEAVQKHAAELEKRVESQMAELLSVNDLLKKQIHEREMAEAILEEEKSLLRNLIDNIPDEIYVKDLQGKIIIANSSMERRLAHRAPGGKVVGSKESDYVSPSKDKKDADESRREELDLLQSGRRFILTEEEVFDEQMNPRWMSMTKIPLTNTQGGLIGLLGMNRDITDSKSAEVYLEQIISGAFCLMWYGIATDDEPIADVYIPNQNAAQNFLPLDLGTDEDYALAWQRSILPEDRQQREIAIQNAAMQGVSGFHTEFRCKRADGEIRWLSEEIQINGFISGRYNLVGICTDITERRNAEEALQKYNELLAHNVEERTAELRKANEILIEQIAERNRAEQAEREQRRLAEALSDASRALSETLELNTVLDRILTYVGRVMPPHDRANIESIEDERYVHTLRQLDYTQNGEVHISSPDERYLIDRMPSLKQMFTNGVSVTVSDTETDPTWQAIDGQTDTRSYIGVPINVEGQVIGFITLYSKTSSQFELSHSERLAAFASQAGIAIKNASLFKAIRDHVVELGERVQDRTRELEHERAQLAAILNAMTEGVIYSDSDGKVQYVNQSLTLLTGYPDEAWHGKDWTQLLIDEAHREHVDSHELETMNRLGRWKTRTRITRKDGHHIDASVVSTLVTGPDMIPTGSVTVIRDISAETRLEAQKTRFIAIASHELRTPITNLKTRLYLLKRQPERLEQHLEILESVAAHMRKLVQDLLDVSRFEHGIIALTHEKLVLQDVVEQVVTIQQAEAHNKNIALKFIPNNTPALISADPVRLTQVFTNLVNNSINYTPPQGKIDVSLHIENDSVVVSVQDTGVGIPENLVDDVFKPFFRVSNSSSGMGLGLNITKEIVEAHEGEITVESQVHQGTCFKVKLPLIP